MRFFAAQKIVKLVNQVLKQCLLSTTIFYTFAWNILKISLNINYFSNTEGMLVLIYIFTCYSIELLDIQGLESRDAVELLRKIKQSFYQPDNISNYVFENVTIVHNAAFNTEVGRPWFSN